MSKELPNNQKQNEEVDLIVFFNLIGNAINKVIDFFKGILKTIFSSIIYALKTLFKSWKIVLGVLLIAAIVGYALEKSRPTIYTTEMLVEPYFNSKYQLVTNINYFNALISNNEKETLKEIFKVGDDVINEVRSFEIEPGPETENDKLLQYEEFISKLDSVRAQDYSYEEFLENRSVYAGRYFLIKANAYKSDIFKDLEGGILNSFTNDYTNKEMKRRDTLIEIQKQNLYDQLKQVDSLKQFYIDVVRAEADNKKQNVRLGEFSITSNESSKTREFDLLKEEQKIRNEIKKLEEEKIEQDVIFEVISSFQRVGNASSSWLEKYSIIFPVLAFILLIIFFIAKKVIIFTLNYED
ncbi:hypothetical protein [Mesoflavibacter sp.]|uniref:hypothetical protein n=1 Tax=Mesoflavibacter sp. TaxID=1930902 RepID=UPI0035156924